MHASDLPFHGGPDAGPDPEFDFSSNANWLGPAPALIDQLAKARPDLYPDPGYTALCEQLAQSRGCDARQVVVGAGAAELIFRSILSRPGPVLSFSPAFGEYHRCAQALGRSTRSVADESEFLDSIPENGCAFVCLPNNPDGRLPSGEFLAEAAALCRARGSRLVLDLAYEPLCQALPDLPEDADWMFAPNKPFSVTGVRAGWMRCSGLEHADRLRPLAPAWCVGTQGVALLEWSTTPEASRWLEGTRTRLWTDRDAFASELSRRGIEVRPTAANWILARSPEHAWSRLRSEGLRVRDTTTMGLPGWLRLSVQSPQARSRFLEIWDKLFKR
ncbi:MAG: hypothetical protein RL318_509 [Fibrobacterota bacterium]|jgi:histidinol-phosphate aminotransferase